MVTTRTQKRSYDDGCAGAHALDLVGERWALLIVRELVYGPKRFTDLRAGLPGISPNVLTQRLDELEQASVLRRHRLPPPASAWVYELTEWGQGLGPLIVDLGKWGARSPQLPRGNPLSVDSLVMSFTAMFDPAAAEGFTGLIELRFGDDRFQLRVAKQRIAAERGGTATPDVTITADPNVLAQLAYDGLKLSEATRSGQVQVEGDKALARRFFGLFTLPAPAPANPPRG
jgi:DNA-binding HxlR family transcriptional regulator